MSAAQIASILTLVKAVGKPITSKGVFDLLRVYGAGGHYPTLPTVRRLIAQAVTSGDLARDNSDPRHILYSIPEKSRAQ